jgi:hypothetical protein
MHLKSINEQYFKFYKLDDNLSNPEEISYVESGKITYNSLSQLVMSASLNVTVGPLESVNLKHVRVSMVLNGVEQTCGTFIVSTPTSDIDECVKSIDVTCYSTLWPVQADGPDYRYFVGQGTNVVAEVKRILDKFGYQYEIEDSDKVTSKGIEWEIGKSWLDIINDLLKSINFTALYVDFNGTYRARPYVLPKDRTIEIYYNSKDIYSILENEMKSELDLFGVHNKFVRYVNDPNVDLVATYENKDGPTGTVDRGITHTSFDSADASDYDTLYEICKRDAAEETSIYHKVTIYTAINLEHLYSNCISLSHYDVSGKFIETSWDIELETGGKMEHNLREAIEC